MMAAEQETDPRLRWLKPLVIGLSVVFVGLLLVLIVGMITGVPGRTQSTTSVPERTQSTTAPTTAGSKLEQTLSLPRGARVLESFGVADRVVLRIRLPDGSERLLSLDARSLTPLAGLTIQ